MKSGVAAAALAGAFLASLAPAVNAHGQVNRVTAEGQSNFGPNIYYAGDAKNAKTAVRKMYSSSSPAYALPKDYRNPSAMACEGSGPAPKTISVKAGDSIKIFWEGATSELKGLNGLTSYNPWVHAMGPVMDYITSCNGDCSKFDATNAGWTKLAEFGLDTSQGIQGDLRSKMAAKPEVYHPTSGNGLWGMAKLVQDGSAWSVRIPSELKAGQYIVRNELAAVHSPGAPQHYIACVQIDVQGGGAAALPAGTKASELYDPNGAFVKYDVYSNAVRDFKVPGPAVWKPSGAAAPAPATTKAAATTKAPETTKAAETPKPAATTKAAETPKPAATTKAAETPKPAATTKAAETPKPAATTKAAETPKPAATTKAAANLVSTHAPAAAATSSAAAAKPSSTKACKRRTRNQRRAARAAHRRRAH